MLNPSAYKLGEIGPLRQGRRRRSGCTVLAGPLFLPAASVSDPFYYIIVCSCTTSRPLHVIDLHVHASPMYAAKLGAVVRLFQLLVILPATNATSERSFSALRRIKSYLRCTMSQARLNHLMILRSIIIKK